MPAEPTKAFDIDAFLAAEAEKDLLRFSTAGSVDDGKSTLIGRLLYDSRNVYDDHVRAVTGNQLGGQPTTINFALLTDGLRAEREQGITIDVAYRYFSTQRRKFIIADTPGHEQYTRNMVTGASTAGLTVVLIDARKGIQTQSRRHAYIASLLGIHHVVAAINKMDLVDFSEAVYKRIQHEFREIVRSFGTAELTTIPVSALEGDNVVLRSRRMPWYDGPTLMEYLEEVPVGADEHKKALRLPVQRVIRPDQNFRGFAGQISAGTLHKGQDVTALPSGVVSRVASITTFDGELDVACAPMSVVVTLEDELDISRGDLLVEPARLPQHATTIEASLVWFDTQPLETYRPYLIKHGPQLLQARITRVLSRININTLVDEPVSSLQMNEIGIAEIELIRPLYFDRYTESRASGSFILIDPQSNATLAAGMIRTIGATTLEDFRHKPVLIYFDLNGQLSITIKDLEDRLFQAGSQVVCTRVVDADTLRGLLALGLTVLVNNILDGPLLEEFKAQGIALVDARHFETVQDLVDYLLLNKLLVTGAALSEVRCR